MIGNNFGIESKEANTPAYIGSLKFQKKKKIVEKKMSAEIKFWQESWKKKIMKNHPRLWSTSGHDYGFHVPPAVSWQPQTVSLYMCLSVH